MDWFNRPETGAGAENAASLTVSEVTGIIKERLECGDLSDIWVRGEVTKFKRHTSGHYYFTLSEGSGSAIAAVIDCKIWKSATGRLSFQPANGKSVVVLGSVNVYPPHGNYSLIGREVLDAGAGEKYRLLEQWKKELQVEGLFAAERKRPLPPFPDRVGVVTSETGAVIHDITNVITRRYPVEIIISPTAVQGDEAHREIAAALRRLAGEADVIIVARGGGSFEDLFPFNHPDVVRAIAASPVPVVSAIGHEVDVTLADLAADIRAPTPSAAAELVVPDRKVLLGGLLEIRCRLSSALVARIERAMADVSDLRDRLRPARFARRIGERRLDLADLTERLDRAVRNLLGRQRLALDRMTAELEGKSPRAIMQRGYCIAEKDGRGIRRVVEISEGDRLRIRLYDGNAEVLTERVDHDRNV